ncbi:MAG: cytidine deaminase [Pyrinomonadaceae bacterium]|nr:cytidine deaminase [Pyrinomonadaceae bacterium]
MSASDAPEQLIDAARNARGFAIAPYSRFRVGAALEATDGRIFTGCNVENATYGLTMCAERVAILKALSEGARSFRRLAVVADTEGLITPCGACRQIIWEFCGDIAVVLANERGQSETLQMRDLLPRPFDAGYLKDAP